MQTFKLLPLDSVMLLQPVLVKNFGKSGALLLSQLHYWLTKKDSLGCDHQGNRWIYNTAEEWAAQLQLSARYIRYLFAELTNLGIVKVEKLHKIKSVRTNYYAIDYDRLNDFIGTANAENSDSHTEKITAPLGKNNLMYKDTKTTIKDFNKSDKFSKNPDVVEPVNSNLANERQTSERPQVKQVKNLKLKPKKVSEAKVLTVVKETEVIPTNPPMPNNSVQASINEKVTPFGGLVAKTSTVQDMLKVWNECLGNKSETKLSKDLAPMFVAAFKNKFDNNIANWQNYCEQLRSSGYLMADAFKLTIGWALKFRTIDRIRAGELGVKLKTTEDGAKDNTARFDDLHQINQMIEALPESSISKGLRHKIARAIGYPAYYSWFHQAKFCEEDGEIRLVAPNLFVAQYWETHFEWVIKH